MTAELRFWDGTEIKIGFSIDQGITVECADPVVKLIVEAISRQVGFFPLAQNVVGDLANNIRQESKGLIEVIKIDPLIYESEDDYQIVY